MARSVRPLPYPPATPLGAAVREIGLAVLALADALDQIALDQPAERPVVQIQAMPEPRWYGLAKAAELLALDTETLRLQCVSGAVPARRYGRLWRIPASYLASHQPTEAIQ